MNAALAQRKYRVTAQLTTKTARTVGLAAVAAFALLLAASAVYRSVTGQYEEYAYYALMAVPPVMIGLAWVQVFRTFPRALANGVTRKETLAALALFGVAAVLAAAVSTQLGVMVIGFFSTFEGVEHHQGFYGLTLAESIVRPAVSFACGAVAAAAMLRFGNRSVGAVVAGIAIGLLLYRQPVVEFVYTEYAKAAGSTASTPELGSMLLPVDLALAALFTITAWLLLLRAPMRNKKA
jgi:hypothetical protein